MEYNWSDCRGIIIILCFVISFLQFNEKGPSLNSEYIYASKKEREAMDKKAHYKQSGIIFVLAGIILTILALDMIFRTGWLFYLVIGIAIITIVYAIVSSVIIEKRRK